MKSSRPSIMARAIAILGLVLAACAAPRAAPPEPRLVLAPSGTLRIGVYTDSPISLLRGGAGREASGVAFDVGRELARRLGVGFEVVEFPRVAEVLAALKAGRVDVTVTNATAARAKDVDFTAPVLLLELGYLVPPGSAVSSIADADRAGMRIGVMQGSTSQTALPQQLKAAAIVPAPSMKAAGEMLAHHELDAFATNKANLFEMASAIPGARVLDDTWGAEHLAIAIPRGRDRARAWLDRFVAEARRDGVVARAVARAGLRGTARAELRVMISAGFFAAYRALVPGFERATHVVVETIRGPSMGDTPEAIPNRLRRGEPADVLIMADSELDNLVRQRRVAAGSRVDLARSLIAAAVRAGAPRPDIGTVDALRRTLAAATSIACSDSASGVYLTTVVFPRLGIADALRGRIAIIPAEPIGAVVARGDAEIGFQTLSALLPIPGIDIVGVLPAELQKPTVFSAVIAAGAAQPDAARDLMAYLRSEAARSAITSAGMEPL